MAVYEFKFWVSYGISHCGEEGDYVTGKVELSEEEADTLVKLIKEKGTSDVDALGLRQSHPDIYKKLDNAHRDAAFSVAEMHWLWDGYENGYFEYDTTEVMEYCKEHLGFVPKEKEDEDDGDDCEYDDDDYDAYYEWEDNYVHNVLNDEEVRDFFYNVLNADANFDMTISYDYTVRIPNEIVERAKV